MLNKGNVVKTKIFYGYRLGVMLVSDPSPCLVENNFPQALEPLPSSRMTQYLQVALRTLQNWVTQIGRGVLIVLNSFSKVNSASV